MITWNSPFSFRSLKIANRVIRASRTCSLAWELRFAEAGVGAIISPCIPIPRAGESVDVALHKRVFFRRLILQSGRVAREIPCDHVELRRRPIAAETMRPSTR